LSFPNVLIAEGLGPLAFIALVPALWAVTKAGRLGSFVGGFLVAIVGFCLNDLWLVSYAPWSFYAVGIISALQYGLLFLVFNLIYRYERRTADLLCAALWIVFEYLKSIGPLGYPFGILGYSQYRFSSLIQIAALAGVWGISALIVFPQFCFAYAIGDHRKKGTILGRQEAVRLLVSVTCIAAAFVLGSLYKAHETASFDAPGIAKIKLALVQPNRPDGPGTPESYRTDLDRLRGLSDSALAEKPDLIVWPETAFIPSIQWHERYRVNEVVYELTHSCISYIQNAGCDFIIGNNESEQEREDDLASQRKVYNAALGFVPGEKRIQIYKKMHLVPVGEYFPLAGLLPNQNRDLEAKRGAKYWTAGDEATTLRMKKATIGTPICFEDAFGGLVRRIAADSDILIPLINDGWSNSLCEETMHMSWSVIRAVENRKYVARCSNSGISCVISPSGKTIARIEPFRRGILVQQVPLGARRVTLYGLWGDWLPFAFLSIIIGGIAVGIFDKRAAWHHRKKNR
jgi:apolipoprotein N-acyltransferase